MSELVLKLAETMKPVETMEAERRASVALILRVVPPADCPAPVCHQMQQQIRVGNDLRAAGLRYTQEFEARARNLREWAEQEWARRGSLEILLIKRAGNPRDRWSGHMAFPGGKQDPVCLRLGFR
jgi:hypothetical protein